MTGRRVPSRDELASYVRRRRNWGRWADESESGAVNLITSEKRVSAARLVTSGRTVSLSREWPVVPTAENPDPASLYVLFYGTPSEGGAGDYLGAAYHGHSVTHVDSLAHVWDEDGLWEGRDPSKTIVPSGVTHGSVDAWREGIVTRGVMVDVPRHRGEAYVSLDKPVHGYEMEEIVASEGLKVEPGDALVVYSGREAYAREHGGTWGGRPDMPGLHPSCLPFVRENDVAVLIWDMLDMMPLPYGGLNLHTAINAFGVVLLDNALLEPLAAACAEEGRYEFMVTICPLVVPGGTGSPVNPIALF